MKLIHLLVILLLLLQSSLFALTDKEIYDSQEYKNAAATFEKKEYEKSFQLFHELMIQNPENEKINFYYGRAAFELENYEFAFAAYDRILIQNPMNHRARLEYARTLYMLEAYDEAKKEFENVLASPIPETVRNNIKKFMQKIKNAKQSYILNSMAIIGFGWNDNINNNTYENITMVGNLATNNNTQKKKDYDFKTILFNNLIVPFKQDKELAWESTAITYMQEQKKYHENDLLLLSFKSGISYTQQLYKNLTSILYDHIWIGGDQTIYTYGLANNTKLRILENQLLDLDIKYKKKKMIDPTDQDKDSTLKELGATYTYFLNKEQDNIKLTSYNIFEKKERGTRTDISSDTNRLNILYEKNLPNKYILDLSYQYERKKFELQSSGLDKRKDTKHSYTLKLTKQLTETKAIFGEFVKTDVNSNINTYKYEKNVFNINYMMAF